IEQTNVTVDFTDETLTSRQAITKMVEGKTTRKKRRLLEDAVAAAIILNSYLEQQV
ncbi:Holliday junction resolvase RuvX, partial [Candidatus Microgenomates bacterium]|nr:Holliday junction resolvase RuvX [Candidatus Microgenomates bacterium]